MEIILIVGHGSPDSKDQNVAFVAESIHRMIHGECTSECVRAAYLQFEGPGLMDAIKTCIADGADRIIVHPYFLGSGVHVTRNIPGIIKEAAGLYPHVEFICTRHLGAHHKLAEVALERINEAADLEKGP